MNEPEDLIRGGLRHVAELCAMAATTAPKSGGQLFLKGARPFLEIRLIEDRGTLNRISDWMRERGSKRGDPIWSRDAETAAKTDQILFIGLANWYPPVYDCGACGFATCAEFMNSSPTQRTNPGADDWEFAGPICQIRCVDLGVAVGSAAKEASSHGVDTRCQTRTAAAARHLGIISADLAVGLAMSVSHKNIFFDRKTPPPSPG
jgi:uncharacterized ferredoxin-like protein